MEMVPHSRPWITEADHAALREVLNSSMLGQGERARGLEQRLAAWLGMADAVAVGSGSAGMVLALHGLGVGPGDEVVLPSYVCRSLWEAILTVGATPVFSDVGRNWVMDVESASRVVGTRTRAIVVPHLYGIFADIEAFRVFGVPIIEDCAQALDGEGIRPAKGDVAVLSFHPTKCLTAGEGGMALAADPGILARMRGLREGDGKGSTASRRLFSPLSDLAAGLAHAQLDRYAQGLARRREIAAHYREAVESCCPRALYPAALEQGMYFRFPLSVPGGAAACRQRFAERSVQVRMGVDELLHRTAGLSDQGFPNTVRHFETTLSLPIYPALGRDQQTRCAEAMAHILPPLFQSTTETR